MLDWLLSMVGVLVLGILVGVALTLAAEYVGFKWLVALSDVRRPPQPPREPTLHPVCCNKRMIIA